MSPSPNSRARLARRVAAELASYAPLLAAFAFFAHLCWFGLRPTLAERARLAEARDGWVEQHGSLDARLGELRAELSAFADPMAQERLRRRMQNAGLKRPAGDS